MRSSLRNITLLIALAVLVASVPATAKPGPVVLTYMERVEYHSDTTTINETTGQSEIGEETYLYTLISAYRKLDKDVFGNLYYIHKYSLDDTDTASNIGGVSITHKMTGKWKMNYSYSYTSNPERGSVTYTTERFDNDRLSFSLTHSVNPGKQHNRHYRLKTTYSTNTDFTENRTLSEKVSVDGKFWNRWKYDLSYQFVWGLTDDPAKGIYRSQFANQWSADFSYKINKKQRLVLGYMYLDKQYHGATDDDNLLRLSYFRSFTGL